MPDSIAGLLEKADLAVASASPLVDESTTAPIAAATAMLRRRLDYPEDLLLVGIAGGTGSGKSSLVNAIVGSEVAAVGGLRPTTDRPLAVASPHSMPRIEGYLSAIGIEAFASHDVPDWLALIDLPDTDSVELGHRLQVESLIPRLDVIVWVVDPEKYRDASLHHAYLKTSSAHSDRFVFVLNQVDRLSGEATTKVVSDLHQALLDDGIEKPTVLAAAVSPPAGPPIGVEELIDHLGSKLGSGVIAKALTDLQEAASALVSALGTADLDFEARASDVMNDAARSISGNREAEAIDHLTGFLETIADEIGAVTGDRMRSAAARVPRQIRQIVEDLRRRPEMGALNALSEPTVFEDADGSSLRVAISERVIAPARETLRERALALALATDLSLSVAAVRPQRDV